MQKLLFTMGFVLLSVWSIAQDYTFSGTVKDEKGEPISGASIRVSEQRRGARSDADGTFSIRLPEATYRIEISHVGWVTQHIDLHLQDDVSREVILHASNDESIQEVTVVGKVGVKKVKESAYNVTVLDAKPTYNTSMEVTSLLNKAAGVRIRQEAGLGSDYNISLNGFTGRAVKIFMDGVPMEGFGSAYNLNNIPTTMIERVDIYKGVVPIEFGGDAMGGVINIITRPLNRTFVDASYSYGSFNTHKSNVNFGYVGKNGFSVDIRALQNYSDNSYRTYTKSLNLASETFSPDKDWYNRFNDTYHNESLVAKVGFVHTSWADQFFIGATVGQEYKEVQNAYVQQLVYGMRHRKGNTLMPSLTYRKQNFLVENLEFNVNANYNQNRNENIDTAARTYNWAGDFKRKRSVGEGAPMMSKFENRNGSVTANARYRLGDRHYFNVNDTYTTFTRKSRNDLELVDELTARDTMRSRTSKNVLGISYQFDSKKNWNMTAFYKLYTQHMIGAVDTSNSNSVVYAEQSRNTANSGYGLAGTYFYNDLQFKLSYEKAYRLLGSNELFGDENLETANTSLRPEKSDNINFNLAYNKVFNKQHDLYVEAGLIYRNTYDYIRRVVEQRYGTISSVNHGRVLSYGADVEMRYAYGNRLMLGGAFTYLATRNQQRYATPNSTVESIIYKDQLPNTPYIYGYLDGQYMLPKLLGDQSVLTLGYAANYIHEFYLGWPSQGSQKYVLPTQFSHDVFVSAALKNGRYNVSLEARNITDELLYDNFELQKPGRNFSVKLRYYFSKRN